MVDVTALNTQIATLTDQVARTEGTEASAGALIAGFSAAIQKAVTDALVADDAADNGSVQAATQAITAVTGRFAAADDKLGAAVAANSGPPVPAPPVAP
jgi:rhamnogalacturonyl hydrolase YesR